MFTVDVYYDICLSTGTTDENLSKFIQHVKIEDEQEFILNWKELGVPIITVVCGEKRF